MISLDIVSVEKCCAVCGCFLGAVAGVSAGAVKFISSKSEVQGPETLKLKTNRLLNSAGEKSAEHTA